MRFEKSKETKIILFLIIILVVISVAVCIRWSKQSNSNRINELDVSNTPNVTEAANINYIEQTPIIQNLEVAEQPTAVLSKEENTILINETLEGNTVSLNINLEVETHTGEKYGLYDACPATIDVDKCLEFVFPDTPKDELYNECETKSYQEYYNVTDLNTLNNTLAHRDNSNYEILVYDTNKAEFPFEYGAANCVIMFPQGGIGHLLRINQKYLEPNQELLSEAIVLSEEFLTTIFEDEFTSNFELTYSGLKKMNPYDDSDDAKKVYLIVYSRKIEELPILFDVQERNSNYYSNPLADELEVWVHNGVVELSLGMIRHLELIETRDIISAQDALEILRNNLDNVSATGTYDIERFELMYCAAFTDNADTTDIYSEQYGLGYVKYIPVWVVASGERISASKGKTTDEYVMVIDATTGEVIQRRKFN